MALVNDEKQFIFFHLFRCAGNSMREVLNTNPILCFEYQGVHSLPRDAKEQLYKDGQKDIYDDYFKFTFVRNPFDWMLSTYLYLNRFDDKIKSMNLRQFIEYYVIYMMLNEGTVLGSNKCTTMFDYITDKEGKIIVDFVGRVENIKEDMSYIFNKICIKQQDIPIINSTPNKQGYREYYDNETRKMVETHFAKDLEHFNYTF